MKNLWLFAVCGSIGFSFLSLFLLSFFSYFPYPLLFPEKFSGQFWENTMFHNSLFYEAVINSFVLGICNGLASTMVGIMGGRALERYEFRGRVAVSWLVSMPLFIPTIVLFIGVHSMMIKFSLINTYLGVVMSHMIISIPYTTSIFRAFFRGIHPDMENVARTLGCKDVMLYRKILVPLLMPGIFLSFGISFLISFSEYFSTFLVGGGSVITLSMIMYPYVNNGDVGNGSVLGIVFLGITVGLFYLMDVVVTKKLKVESYLYG